MKRRGSLVESGLTGRPHFDGSLGVWFGRSDLHVRDVVNTIARPALNIARPMMTYFGYLFINKCMFLFILFSLKSAKSADVPHQGKPW